MRLIMTLLVRNEADILAENIEFHLAQGVDYIIATDNGSIDSTVDVLRHYASGGVLEIIHEPRDDYSQWKWVTRMARRATRRYGADWVINNDADEFWYPREGTLKTTLKAMPAEINRLAVWRRNFVPISAGESEKFYECMVYRERKSYNDMGRPLPPKVCHRGLDDVVVSQGNHSIETDDYRESLETEAIEILHFPLRSYRQFATKIRLGGAAYARNRELGRHHGKDWRKLYGKYLAGELFQHYEQQRFTGDMIAEGLRDGTLVEDRRLLDFLVRENEIGTLLSSRARA